MVFGDIDGMLAYTSFLMPASVVRQLGALLESIFTAQPANARISAMKIIAISDFAGG
jgi:hypothetical protein